MILSAVLNSLHYDEHMIFALIGFCVGVIGTMIGAGGGFLLLPILIILLPGLTTSQIAALSITAVAFNATSGSITYFAQRKLHHQAAWIFTLASLPGAVIGEKLEQYVPRTAFEAVFGCILMIYSIVLLKGVKRVTGDSNMQWNSPLNRIQITKGCLISFGVGFVASFLGIGGGVIHVPMLSQLLSFPVHLAVGTSHFILAITAWVTAIVHFVDGDIHLLDANVIALCISIALGAQLGARLSKHVHGHTLLRILGIALFFVGARLLFRVIHLS